jgi:hypothetical protein
MWERRTRTLEPVNLGTLNLGTTNLGT